MGYSELALVGQALLFLLSLLLLAYSERRQRQANRELLDRLEAHTHRNAAGAAVDGESDAQDWKPGPHSHVWGPTPFDQDSVSKSFRCQVHGCERIHTQSLR